MSIINEIVINMENEIFRGNLLDVGTDNYGIIYNIYK
ncbi:MAG: class I SAM-dependent methyltransferase, partial [Clostridium sp.]|nr:class I SAM-dependent methyltransferase [Clostridium sp.]